jgi:hypothetical protein
MAKPFTPVDFACPTCGANPQEPCCLYDGGVRFQSHGGRLDVAEGFEAERKLRELQMSEGKAEDTLPV